MRMKSILRQVFLGSLIAVLCVTQASAFSIGLGLSLTRGGGVIANILQLALPLNASQTAPLTAVKGTAPTLVSTSQKIVPTYQGAIADGVTLTTIAANNPAIPYAGYRGGAWYSTDSADAALATSAQTSESLTYFTGGGGGNNGLGVIFETAETQYAKYTQDLSNGVWAATNCTGAKNAVGTDGAANSASTLTASANDATLLQSVTLTSGARGFFPYIKRKTGTGSVYVTIDNGTTWVDVTSSLSTTAWYRASATKTAANPVFGFKLATNGDAIYVDHAGLLGSAVASSPIPNTSAASVTRAATYATISGSQIGEQGKFRFTSNEAMGSASRAVTLLGDGTRRLRYDGTNLVLQDTSQTIGSELVTNGSFTTDASWTKGTGWTIPGDGTAVATSVGTNIGITQTVTLVVGKQYAATIVCSALTGGQFRFKQEATYGTTRTAAGTYTEIFTATTKNTTLGIFGISPLSAAFDSISVKEVAEIVQPTTFTAGQTYTIGWKTAANDWALAVDGTDLGTSTAPAAGMTWAATTYLGANSSGAEVVNGYLTLLRSDTDGISSGYYKEVP